MYPEQFQAIIAIFLHINGLAFGQLNSQADVINNCSSSTSCIRTYDQVYQSLTKSDNSYNISYALYPGRLNPSSVRVFVNVYGLGPYKSKNSVPAQYTWSMSCLYATIPSRILELLSFGTILVTPRTQELNLQIPLFCCNVSEDKGGRKRIIHEMLTRAIADIKLEFGNVGFWGEEKTGVPREKPLGAEKRTKNKLNPHMTSRLGIEPGPH